MALWMQPNPMCRSAGGEQVVERVVALERVEPGVPVEPSLRVAAGLAEPWLRAGRSAAEVQSPAGEPLVRVVAWGRAERRRPARKMQPNAPVVLCKRARMASGARVSPADRFRPALVLPEPRSVRATQIRFAAPSAAPARTHRNSPPARAIAMAASTSRQPYPAPMERAAARQVRHRVARTRARPGRPVCRAPAFRPVPWGPMAAPSPPPRPARCAQVRPARHRVVRTRARPGRPVYRARAFRLVPSAPMVVPPPPPQIVRPGRCASVAEQLRVPTQTGTSGRFPIAKQM
jgi:hypothetical protein